jgi:hypothetical protein
MDIVLRHLECIVSLLTLLMIIGEEVCAQTHFLSFIPLFDSLLLSHFTFHFSIPFLR